MTSFSRLECGPNGDCPKEGPLVETHLIAASLFPHGGVTGLVGKEREKRLFYGV